MYTSLLYGYIKEKTSKTLASLIECELIPSLQTQRGYEGWRLVINQDYNKLALHIYWHTKEDAIKVSKSGVIRDQLDKIIPLLANKPNLKFFDLN
ncbi:MAG: hypothetical protein JSV04_02685 [Candidatus Heimdallarchaeota archaeon]|nr:MAG: hypothetical protein JSV04_02685 [Candidatus Heimdallarchaeota archaeon]